MKLVPLGDRVVLKPQEAEKTTKSGIVLPGNEKEKPQQAEVLAVGPGGVIDGKEVKMQVSVGQNVIYSKYAGTTVKLDDTEYIIVKQSDILAVVEDESEISQMDPAIATDCRPPEGKQTADLRLQGNQEEFHYGKGY